jgi:hypothetical protein
MDKMDKIEKEIIDQQKTVDFDTREFTIEIMVNKYLKNLEEENNELFVPDYQREFVWDTTRQSRLIESIILGLPIPIIFVAENKDGRLEIVDGSQRIRTLSAFLSGDLTLEGLDKLSLLNNLKFQDLSISRQRKINNTPIRMIVLSDKTSETVKNDLFDRINRGSDLLLNMEKRKGIYKGKFNDFIYDKCAKLELLKKLAPLSKVVEKRQEHEELILRFFALADNYPKYKTQYQGIGAYLDEYMNAKNSTFTSEEADEKYTSLIKVLEFVNENFENGFSKKRNQGVSRVFFEAISVGTFLALKEKPNLKANKLNIQNWIQNKEFKAITSGKYKTHVPEKILQRINFVKDKLLNS